MSLMGASRSGSSALLWRHGAGPGRLLEHRFTAAAAGLAQLQSLRCPGSPGERTVPAPTDLEVPSRGAGELETVPFKLFFHIQVSARPSYTREGRKGAEFTSPRSTSRPR